MTLFSLFWQREREREKERKRKKERRRKKVKEREAESLWLIIFPKEITSWILPGYSITTHC